MLKYEETCHTTANRPGPNHFIYICQAIGKSSVGQHVSLTSHQMSSIEEASTTTPQQQQRQTLPESSSVINPLHSSSSTGSSFVNI